MTARSPVENDRAELLKEVEPIDYSSVSGRYGIDPFADEVVQDNGGDRRYQGQGQSRSSSLWNSAPAAPRQGLFDDI